MIAISSKRNDKRLLQKTREAVKLWRYTGCIKLPDETAKSYAEKNKSINNFGKFYKRSADWKLLCSNVNIEVFFTGYWKDIVMPMEGYKVIATHWGNYVKHIETIKRLDFDKQKLDFSKHVIYGDFKDA